MKKSLVLLALMSVFGNAYATNNGNDTNCNGNGSCGQTTTNNTTNQGGAGGVGYGGQGVGYGGSATGGSASVTSTNVNAPTATGGSVLGSGNSNVDTRNTNTNINGVTSTNANNVTGINGQQQGQSQESYNEQGQSQSANNEGVTGNSVSINVAAPKTYRPPVSSAIAPTIFPTAPCMGSSSVGATGTLFSISGGSSWTSEECMILETARSFDQAGYAQDGLVVRCQGKWAKNAPSCKALEPVASKPSKPVAAAEVKATTKSVAIKSVAQTQTVETAENGYYSVNTNPLTK